MLGVKYCACADIIAMPDTLRVGGAWTIPIFQTQKISGGGLHGWGCSDGTLRYTYMGFAVGGGGGGEGLIVSYILVQHIHVVYMYT